MVIGYDEYEGVIDEKFVPDTDGGYINAEHTFVAEEGNGDATEGIYISFVKDGDYWVLYYVYETEPNALYSENNPIQKGTVWLEIEKPKSGI